MNAQTGLASEVMSVGFIFAKQKHLRRFILVLLSLSIIAGCSRGRPVHYVVPVDYRGPFWVVQDSGAPELPIVGRGWRQVNVPANGIILTSSLAPLDAWHESTAVLGSMNTGADLEVGKTIVSPAMVGVWLGPRGRVENREYRSFFVGTEAEFVAFPRERFQLSRLQ
jgi:hypothetical protein